jgi:hypothetical protein
MSKTAKQIAVITDWKSDARVFELSEPLDGHKFVIVSAVDAMFSGPETYIFPAVAKGEDWEASDMGELDGSFRGDLNHAEALRNAGYEIA